MIAWFEFLLVTGLILYSGSRLSRLWLGLVLMAAVTSLPEPATGLSSVIVDCPTSLPGTSWAAAYSTAEDAIDIRMARTRPCVEHPISTMLYSKNCYR